MPSTAKADLSREAPKLVPSAFVTTLIWIAARLLLNCVGVGLREVHLVTQWQPRLFGEKMGAGFSPLGRSLS